MLLDSQTPDTMSSSFRWLVTALCCLNHAAGFGIAEVADSFHVMQSAASSMAHHATVAHHTSLVHHAASHHSHKGVDLLHAYQNLLASHPLPTKMATGASLAVAGDAIAQSREPDAEYDTSRASSFALFDSAYRTVQHYAFPFIVQHCQGKTLASALASVSLLLHHHEHQPATTIMSLLIHNHHHPHALVDPTYLAAMEQTLASQLGIVPFFYYPVFFAFTAAMQGLDFDGAVVRAKDNFLPLMQRNLLFWIPVQFVQFAFVPQDLQIPFLSACGLAWTFILSVSAGAAVVQDEEITNLIDEMKKDEADEQLVSFDVNQDPVGQGEPLVTPIR